MRRLGFHIFLQPATQKPRKNFIIRSYIFVAILDTKKFSVRKRYHSNNSLWQITSNYVLLIFQDDFGFVQFTGIIFVFDSFREEGGQFQRYQGFSLAWVHLKRSLNKQRPPKLKVCSVPFTEMDYVFQRWTSHETRRISKRFSN